MRNKYLKIRERLAGFAINLLLSILQIHETMVTNYKWSKDWISLDCIIIIYEYVFLLDWPVLHCKSKILIFGTCLKQYFLSAF